MYSPRFRYYSALLLAILLASASSALAAVPVKINPPQEPVQVSAADLELELSSPSLSVDIGSTMTVTMSVKNLGEHDALNVRLDDNLPAGWSYVDPKVPAALNLGAIKTGRSKKIAVPITIGEKSPAGAIAYEVVARADNADPVENFVTITVRPGQVLGATDEQLAETGTSAASLYWLLFGLGLIVAGTKVLHRSSKYTSLRR
ncbi:MAG: DUF11 domain-containing protein [Candidatus Kerfeldbacteria bacterium]|nr:DUF11 domain-containing protein [Candidatus Kerfeldbacteria bacterium]